MFTKMYLFKLLIILFSLNFHANLCQRRIKGGKRVFKGNDHLGYVVYLLKSATVSPQYYENWLCGGAIVSKSYIVTSAACVIDVIHLYAIAGYDTYVNEYDINKNSCTEFIKKKIVYSCIPKEYELVYHRPEKWSAIDIAVVKVESPYNFEDDIGPGCSYKPAQITINYDSKYQQPGIDAIVLGWGHPKQYRQDMDIADYNEKTLQFAPVLIQNKTDCKKGYHAYAGMASVIDNYMICTSGKGNLDDTGTQISTPKPTAQGCVSSLLRNNKLRSNLPECKKKEDHVVKAENTRKKNIKPTNLTVNGAERKLRNLTNSRRNDETDDTGICQNDHGGPLVTWVGAHQVLIGVASAFKISETRDCIGPYLYTSTQCNGAFLNCIVALDLLETNTLRRDCKNLFNETGYKLFEKHISWKDHPDGPADNERNSTTHASVKNTTSNVTLNLKNSKEEGNKTDQVQNTTKFDTNTNDTKLRPADNERNSTTHASVKNTTSNETLNVKNSKEEGNKTDQVQNTTKFVTNTNDNKLRPADNERNSTTHASVKNTTSNETLNLKNSKEEGNKTDQVQNTTKFVTNTNDNKLRPADNERNSTTHASVKNTTSNETLNLKNSKEEGNKTDQVQNTTKFVTNTNDNKLRLNLPTNFTPTTT